MMIGHQGYSVDNPFGMDLYQNQLISCGRLTWKSADLDVISMRAGFWETQVQKKQQNGCIMM